MAKQRKATDEHQTCRMQERAALSQHPNSEFLLTELKTGLTFAKIALHSTSPDKVSRNTANARKAYDTALRFLSSAESTEDDSRNIDKLVAKLKSQLQELGEAI